MHKVSRSLLFVSMLALGGLAACGDDITIPPQPPTVTLAPNPVQVAVGATATITPAVNNAQGTVTRTWATGNAAIATVDQNGVVTGVANGSTSVTLTVTGSNGTAVATTTVNVGAGAGGQAAVTIQGVNVTVCGLAGCNSVPATLNNIQGQIDVTLNVETAGQPVQRVELVVRDVATGAETVCGSQNITSAVVSAEEAEAAAAQVPITISCNTAALTAAGIPSFLNGQKEIRARLIGANNQVINSVANTFQVTFANQSAFTLTVANTPTTPAALRTADGKAVSTVDGLLYHQGGLTLTFTGANYQSGAQNTFETMNGQLVLVRGVGPATIPFTGTKVAGTNNFTATITAATLATATAAYDIQVIGSTTTGGTVGPNTIVNDSPINEDVRVDNVDPTNTGNFDAALATNFFVNGTYAFSATNAALFDAPVAPADPGPAAVGGTQVKFFVGTDAVVDAAMATVPAELTAAELATLTEVTTAETLAATLQNNVYGVIAVTYDRLGNHVAQRLAVNIGVDKVAPTGFAYSAATPTQDATLTVAPTVGYDPTNFADDASGFGVNSIRVKITRLDQNNTTAATAECALGATAACNPTAQPNTFTYTPAVNGYYTVASQLTDTAGNVTAVVTRTFLYDNQAPAFTGGLTIPNLLTPGQSYSFTPTITDDIDLDVAYLVTQFNGGARVRFAMADLGSYGEPLTQTAQPTLTVASLPRSFQQVDAAGAPVANPGSDLNAISVRAYDVAGNTAIIDQAIPAQNLAAAPTAADWTAATVGISTFTITAPATGFDVENDATINAGGAPETVDLVAEVLATGLDINNPFDQLVFWYQDAATGEYVQIGAATASVTTNAANQRIFRYTLTAWNPPASLGTGASINVVATGIKGVNILASQPIVIDLVP